MVARNFVCQLTQPSANAYRRGARRFFDQCSRAAGRRYIKRYYYPQDAHAGSPYVIVTAWPIGGTVDGFNIVLTTANPSLLKRLSSGLD